MTNTDTRTQIRAHEIMGLDFGLWAIGLSSYLLNSLGCLGPLLSDEDGYLNYHNLIGQSKLILTHTRSHLKSKLSLYQ